MDRIHVVLAIDTNYVMPAAASIRSILDNSAPEDELSVTVIVDGVEVRHQERIRRSLNLDRHSLSFIEHTDAVLSGLPIQRRGLWSRANYLPLLLPQYLPDLSRVIYLDADTITRSSLAPLWNTDVTGKSLAAVVDPNTRTLDAPDGLQALPQDSDPGAPFFNAGVMLVNLSHWRDNLIPGRALAYIRENGHISKSMEQEALNYCLLGDFVVLDPSWNVMNYWERGENIDEHPDLLKRAKIRHYEYKLKPWAYATHTMSPTQAEFFEYLDKTDWCLWRPPLLWSQE